MERLLFEFSVIPSLNDNKSNILAITSITTNEGKCYLIPNELQPINNHNEITKTSAYTKLKNSLKKRHQTRKIWIKLNEKLKETYVDEEGNIQFSDQYLEEINIQQTAEQDNNLQKILEKLIESTEKKENQQNIQNISEKFIIEKFTSRNSNATQWIDNFEKECMRFNIKKDETIIEIFRLFLDKPCQDWYSSMVTKLTVNTEWNEWKCKFLETFKHRGWNMVTYAFALRYKEGLLIDYAMKKERLLLDINKYIDSTTLIDLIATGLPGYILNKINREDLKDSTDLFNEIRKHEGMIYKKSSPIIKNTTFTFKNKANERKACKTCEDLNKGVRYHPEERCWFKTKINEQEKNNKTKNVNNNSILEVDLINKKN